MGASRLLHRGILLVIILTLSIAAQLVVMILTRLSDLDLTMGSSRSSLMPITLVDRNDQILAAGERLLFGGTNVRCSIILRCEALIKDSGAFRHLLCARSTDLYSLLRTVDHVSDSGVELELVLHFIHAVHIILRATEATSWR